MEKDKNSKIKWLVREKQRLLARDSYSSAITEKIDKVRKEN